MLLVLGVVVVVVGLAGLVLPALPGMPLVFLGLALVAWADDFARIGVPMLVALGALAVLGTLFDYAAGLLGARRAGASHWGLLGAVVGLIAGLPLGIAGLVMGPVLGATLFEYAKDTDIRRSARAGVGVLIGFLLGTALKYAVAMTMVGLAILAYVW